MERAGAMTGFSGVLGGEDSDEVVPGTITAASFLLGSSESVDFGLVLRFFNTLEGLLLDVEEDFLRFVAPPYKRSEDMYMSSLRHQ